MKDLSFLVSGLLVIFFTFGNTSSDRKIIYVCYPGGVHFDTIAKCYSKGQTLNFVESSAGYTPLNRDNCRYHYHCWAEKLKSLRYTIQEIRENQLNDLQGFEALVCFDVPSSNVQVLKKYDKKKLFVYLMEPPVIKSWNYSKEIHEHFGTVFTWIDDLVDNKKYFKFYEPQANFDFIGTKPFSERKLAVMLSGCFPKRYNIPHNLYIKRQEVVDFFEKNAPSEFDLFGFNWPKYKVYKGFTKSHTETFGNYKFAICFENTSHLQGYITGHKIFNPMRCGAVPVFQGATNITDHIPTSCFIDARQFETIRDLYDHLKSITEEQYNEYIKNIKEFLDSPQAHLFSPEKFADDFIFKMS